MTNSGVIVDNSNCKYKATNVGHHNFEIWFWIDALWENLWFKLLHQSLQIPINRKYIRKYNRKYNRKYRKTATWVHDHDMFWNYCKCRLATYNILLTNHFWKCSAITEPQTSIEILINCLEPSNIIMSMWYNMNIQPVRFGGVAGLYGIWKDLKKDIPCMYNWMYLII